MTDNPPDLKKIIRALNDQVTSAWSHLYAWRQIGYGVPLEEVDRSLVGKSPANYREERA